MLTAAKSAGGYPGHDQELRKSTGSFLIIIIFEVFS